MINPPYGALKEETYESKIMRELEIQKLPESQENLTDSSEKVKRKDKIVIKQ